MYYLPHFPSALRSPQAGPVFGRVVPSSGERREYMGPMASAQAASVKGVVLGERWTLANASATKKVQVFFHTRQALSYHGTLARKESEQIARAKTLARLML